VPVAGATDDKSSMNQSPIAQLIAQSLNPPIPNQSLNLQSPIAQFPRRLSSDSKACTRFLAPALTADGSARRAA